MDIPPFEILMKNYYFMVFSLLLILMATALILTEVSKAQSFNVNVTYVENNTRVTWTLLPTQYYACIWRNNTLIYCDFEGGSTYEQAGSVDSRFKIRLGDMVTVKVHAENGAVVATGRQMASKYTLNLPFIRK